MIKETAILHDPADYSGPALGSRRPLGGVILLGGAVRPTRFNTSIARSVLELPYAADHTLYQKWCDEISALPDSSDRHMPLRILMDKARNEPAALSGAAGTCPGGRRSNLPAGT